MLTPRSYLFSRHSSAVSTKERDAYCEERSKGARRKHDATVRNAPREMSPTTTAAICKPLTTSSPLVIPVRNNRECSRDSQRHTERKDGGKKQPHTSAPRARDVHSPTSIPPSVAALLAVTSIPPPKSKARRVNQLPEQRLTVKTILSHTIMSESEKEFNLSFGKGPMDLLLSSPTELSEDDEVNKEVCQESYFSSRTISSESIPSLKDGSPGERSPSLASLTTPSPRRRRPMPTRRIESLRSSSEGNTFEHPLSEMELDIEQLDFRVFAIPTEGQGPESSMKMPLPPRKSAFKSNLTASLNALKYAARSISSIKTPMLSPDDFLTRSIISIDPQVPFTDERMPPRLEDMPTPALRRYLNPTTNAPIEAHVPRSLAQTSSTTKCTASIQMQTYRVSRSSKSTTPNVISRRTTTTTAEEVFAEVAVGPLARQRDMRENSDFIRIAVMEMLMRKNGKLDERMPGRAKWALPPRKPSTKVYEIGEGGVPVRWIGITA
jgi:hypothetical protein